MKSMSVFFLTVIIATAGINSEKKSIKDFQKYVLQHDFSFKNDILDDIGHIFKIAVPTETAKYKAETSGDYIHCFTRTLLCILIMLYLFSWMKNSQAFQIIVNPWGWGCNLVIRDNIHKTTHRQGLFRYRYPTN